MVERGFISHEDDSLDMTEGVFRDLMVDRVEVFQQIKVSMNMKTNVPEPYQAEVGEELMKEGLPVGLSDSQVSFN